ncbi:MAG: glycosyltransferase family 4 protein [Syntrophomonadaceae bacterium]|jgi:glycosyltransferase involved in cell wall biosynthesis
MRIAVFSDTYYPQVNGVSVILGKMKDYMQRHNIEYLYFVPGDTAEPGVFAFGGTKFPLYPELLITMPSYHKIASLMDQFRPDIVHLATEFSLGWQGMKYALRHDLPVTSTYHTNFVQYLRYYKLPFLEKPGWRYLRWFHRRCQINFTPSISTLRLLEQHGIPNLRHCPHGIDSELFNPLYRSEKLRSGYLDSPEGILLLYVGRIAPEKDLEVLLKAAALLNQHGLQYKLLMVGDGPSRRKLENLNIDNVLFLGYKHGQELYDLYASADIFVFPSVTETFGNVVLEAMASGLPVVAALAGGVEDNLLPGKNGLAFKPGEAFDMAQKIEKLMTDKELRLTLSKGALEHARSRSWDGILADFFASLSELL